ncbi:hypothetical protein [Escherichia coli]|uniref:hypothetical protein n=1 Tax=Escherichia coli TaxID=562 RepID=UPI0003A9C396|nr:hypothetical protein [Escherichia coli]
MMKDTENAASRALTMLNDRLNDWQHGASPVWNSTWPVFERLIARHEEMEPVYAELEEKCVTGQRLWVLLEQCIFSGGIGTADNHAALRADYRELQSIGEEIPLLSIRLATLLRRRSDILNRSGAFSVNTMTRVTDYLDAAGRENGLYQSWIQPELEALSRFELKYWPDFADVLQVLAEEPAELSCRDESTHAIVGAKRASMTDFFRELFCNLHEVADGSPWGLPLGLMPSDSALATLSNIVCDLPVEAMIGEEYVKRVRQRLREQGFSAVW